MRGIDSGDVEAHGDAKSISRDDTFPRDINDDDELGRELLALVTRAAADLRGDGADGAHDHRSHSRPRLQDAAGEPHARRAVISDRVILEVARALLAKLRKARRVPARLLGVGARRFTVDSTANQLTLFEREVGRDRDDEGSRSLARDGPGAREVRREAIAPGRKH